MDKKNTMLLTVIAVATLLVAVVGATFAYFSVANAENQTIQANVQTGKIPTVAVTSDHSNLYLKVSAAEMANYETPKYYYAKDTDCPEEASCNKPGTTSADDDKYIDIAQVAITGGDNDTKYTCTGKIEVTSDSLTDIEGLTNGDITIGLKNLTGSDDTASVDAQIVKDKGQGATQNLNFKFTGNQSATISAYVLLENSTQNQSYLAGKNLTFKIGVNDVKCTIDTTPAE